jgi:hypothetical protein
MLGFEEQLLDQDRLTEPRHPATHTTLPSFARPECADRAGAHQGSAYMAVCRNTWFADTGIFRHFGLPRPLPSL